MTPGNKLIMIEAMKLADDDSLPDGAWQARLQEAAEEWGRRNGVNVDGFDAFIDYVEFHSKEAVAARAAVKTVRSIEI